MTSHDFSDQSDEVQKLVNLFKKYHKRLVELEQAETLMGLDMGIDVDRFAQEEDYRREVILTLARCEENFTVGPSRCQFVDYVRSIIAYTSNGMFLSVSLWIEQVCYTSTGDLNMAWTLVSIVVSLSSPFMFMAPRCCFLVLVTQSTATELCMSYSLSILQECKRRSVCDLPFPGCLLRHGGVAGVHDTPPVVADRQQVRWMDTHTLRLQLPLRQVMQYVGCAY